MLTIHVWPRWVKEFLLTHPLYKSPDLSTIFNLVFHLVFPSLTGSSKAILGLSRPFQFWEKKGPKMNECGQTLLGIGHLVWSYVKFEYKLN